MMRENLLTKEGRSYGQQEICPRATIWVATDSHATQAVARSAAGLSYKTLGARLLYRCRVPDSCTWLLYRCRVPDSCTRLNVRTQPSLVKTNNNIIWNYFTYFCCKEVPPNLLKQKIARIHPRIRAFFLPFFCPGISNWDTTQERYCQMLRMGLNSSPNRVVVGRKVRMSKSGTRC